MSPDLSQGTILCDTWRIDQIIGSGGIGCVFAATDLKLDRKVAVKVLLEENRDPDTIKRFEREAQVMARLDHPNLVVLYGFRRHQGLPFLVMRFLEGRSLSALRDDSGGRVPLSTLRPLIRQLLEALAYMHQRGLVHRDIKPSNVFVSPEGKLTLLDFGLARSNATTLTRTGVVFGTPNYMAPEQILAQKELDGRTDLYAVGGLLYRMLTGEMAFEVEDQRSLLAAHVTRDRPDCTKVCPDLPRALGPLIQKAMAIHKEERFANAKDFLAAFESACDSPPRGASKKRPPR